MEEGMITARTNGRASAVDKAAKQLRILALSKDDGDFLSSEEDMYFASRPVSLSVSRMAALCDEFLAECLARGRFASRYFALIRSIASVWYRCMERMISKRWSQKRAGNRPRGQTSQNKYAANLSKPVPAEPGYRPRI